MKQEQAMRRVAVYCGSAPGTQPEFMAEARALGEALAAAGLDLVYGGASVGLMGAVADAALAGGSQVIGVLPEILAGSEIAHHGLTTLELLAELVVQVGHGGGREQGPLALFHHAAHEQVGDPVGRVHVVRAAAVVAGVLAQLQELLDVEVPAL